MSILTTSLSLRLYAGTLMGLTVFFCLIHIIKIEGKPDEKISGPKYRTFFNVHNLPLFLAIFIISIAMRSNGDPLEFRKQLISTAF